MKLKKFLKRTSIVLGILIIILVATPYLFKDKLKAMVAEAINNNVNASVTFDDIGLSLFSNFPKASLTIDKLIVKNHAPFLGDTLFYADYINLNMSIGELFKNKTETLDIKSFYVHNGLINVRSNKDGVKNYEIAKPVASEKPENSSLILAKPIPLRARSQGDFFKYWNFM